MRQAQAIWLMQDRHLNMEPAARLAAYEAGFEKNLFLTDFDSPYMGDLVQKHGVAPLAPQPDARVAYCDEGYGLVRYRSDRFGFRNDDHVWDRASGGVVLLGDSFVHGACQNEPYTLAGQLKGKLQGSVLNLGTAGNGPIHYAAVAKTFLPVIRPRLAVMVFFANDNLDESKSVYRSFLDGDLEYLIRGRDGSLGLAPSVKALYADAVARIPAPLGADPKPYTPAPQTMLAIRQWEAARRAQRVGRADVLAWQSRLRLDALRSAVRDRASDWQGNVPWSTSVAVDTLKQYCRPPECQPLVAYIPPSEFWSPDSRAEHYREGLKRYAEHAHVRFVDASPELESIGPRAYARSGPHLSPDGYEAVAGVISKAIHDSN
ncbi:GDSL-type esterase/lipase family protein [Achromobacter anxifer]|uniref:GDSL-type esterase/lipase family protein n=1 Tax=Achromobacter anxifer TaxID=1287737 RepID=UPI0023F91A5C|nr:GDSL-type esterase/lipase family protein [Achromobacter anxifer]MDF8364710.1 GDSL-type esterase/lipase family protein [Achromobacter anxifer]